MKDLKELLEASLLQDVNTTLNITSEDINKNILNNLLKSKSKKEFDKNVELLKTILDIENRKPQVGDVICNISNWGGDSIDYHIVIGKYCKRKYVNICFENGKVELDVRTKGFNISLITNNIPGQEKNLSGILPKEIIIKDLF